MADERQNPEAPEPERTGPVHSEGNGTPDVPAGGRPTSDRPEDKPAAEDAPRKPGGRVPAETPTPTPATDRPAAGPAREEPAAKQPATKQPTTEGPTTEGPAAAGPATGEATAEEPADRAAEKPEPEAPSGRRRLASGLWPPRINRNQLVVALLLFVLGLGLAIQVRQTSEGSALRGARQEDLVRILDELDDRTTRLEDEKTRLERQRSELENSSDQAEEARRQTRERERQLGVLAGTVAAQGPGIHFEIGDPRGVVEADKLLDAIQELRAAGAEAIQVNGVRVVAETFFSDASGGVRIDGRKVTAPYRFDVIGKPQDLEPALNIPGGVVQTLQKEQATVTIEPSEKIVVDALRTAKRPDYARSSSQ
ncbi:DUF881 domain-containing protein [Streptomyces alkaliterrae]|uniref:DUF881 domain-containing protein n=1 Tax=Streptomyces alkaliterrae TaxID=2213162 RepID=A0A5P0YKF9_9ACTN|nr:DUF881 domain-containing protein [Streptomyces alkaliterrae]MBB1251979.1 DUF881 domain-containing protein [Streptomyces alkaliterrae]MBB1257386.1 DUF881 domain-containing protein [Streptomyces alkaliterrae]MQS00718.1 DUF881 domain-containing protein [Streptomyces alkaliterrae]